MQEQKTEQKQIESLKINTVAPMHIDFQPNGTTQKGLNAFEAGLALLSNIVGVVLLVFPMPCSILEFRSELS